MLKTVHATKLFEIKGLADGTRRFQSQLSVGSDMADFVMGKDGILRCYGHGENGFSFYEYNKPYHIVSNIAEMRTQIL